MDGGARMTLDHQVVDAMLGEKQRGRQPDEAAADDQDRYFLVGHGARPLVRPLPPGSPAHSGSSPPFERIAFRDSSSLVERPVEVDVDELARHA